MHVQTEPIRDGDVSFYFVNARNLVNILHEFYLFVSSTKPAFLAVVETWFDLADSVLCPKICFVRIVLYV